MDSKYQQLNQDDGEDVDFYDFGDLSGGHGKSSDKASRFDMNSPSTAVVFPFGDGEEFNRDPGAQTSGGSPPVDSETPAAPEKSIWKLGYYKKFFDVDTEDVTKRLLKSLFPVSREPFLSQCDRTHPDLYGPFWTAVTLVFTIAISGNIGHFLEENVWKYDFHKVTAATTCIFFYALIVPSLIWMIIWWNKQEQPTNTSANDTFGNQGGAALPGDNVQNPTISYLELICIYGYSLTVFVPASMLSAIPYQLVHWVAVLVAFAISALTLISSLHPAAKSQSRKVALMILSVAGLFHVFLCLGFLFYLFHGSEPAHPHHGIDNSTVQTNHSQTASTVIVSLLNHTNASDTQQQKLQQMPTQLL